MASGTESRDSESDSDSGIVPEVVVPRKIQRPLIIISRSASGTGSSDSESGNDRGLVREVPVRKVKKPPQILNEHSEKEPKKLTTKEMVHSALEELKSRKGASLYAIKKYMVEKYNVDTEKINYHIKKYIKSGVEDGTIVRTKGIGASGSFKLAPVKKADKKPKKMKVVTQESKKEQAEKTEKPKKVPPEKSEAKKVTKKTDKTKEKSTKEKDPQETKVKVTKETKKRKVTKESKKESKMVVKTDTDKKSPVKKKAPPMRRKSVGSIIKPPKMKPKIRE